MPISWNEIRHRAIAFSKEWAGETRERAESQTFWNEFFNVFGLRRRQVAVFEEPVKNIKGKYGFIDLFWRGTLIVEHKSFGADLDQAKSEAIDYMQDLIDEGRKDDQPRYIIISDFARIALHDLDEDTSLEFPLKDFHKRIHEFAFIPGYKQHSFEEEDPVNIKAAGLLGQLHDTLKENGYTGHALERFLVRILFCLFADDTGLFERNTFTMLIEQTRQDGADLGPLVARIFEVLNTPQERRQKNLDESIAVLPHVDGGLFKEALPIADFNSSMRDELLRCAYFDWSQISPAVFGSLFQSVMEPKERRQIGGHYTSERDILKVVRSLFLDDLWAEFKNVKSSKPRLKEFHKKLAAMRFMDPACGCGNFLVVTYREIRFIELEVLKVLYGTIQTNTDIDILSKLDVDMMYGIEINEFPACIAEVALWLVDHQMNQRLSEVFGLYFARLPLRKSPNIVHGNALRLDWRGILPPDKCSYILGNPPFVGKHLMTDDQQADMESVWGSQSGAGVLDYVTAWYRKAAEYIQDTRIVVGYVSTNSISQGEQVEVLWRELFNRYHVKIHFAHRTFAWMSEARGKAHVHVVIIGFAVFDADRKRIYEYESGGEKVTVSDARNISPYLIEGSDLAVASQTKPICNVPECIYGNKPTDGGYLIVEETEREEFLKQNHKAVKFLRPLLCAEEYLYSIPRWCLWLVDAAPSDIRDIAGIRERVQAVKEFRLASKKEPTRRKAEIPTLFAEIRQPKSRFIVIPRHTSEMRRYVPFGYFEPIYILHDSCSAIPNATLYHFGVISSAMHMAWIKTTCGRIKSDIRYSISLVYNNYPWPEKLMDRQQKAVEEKAKAVLDARKSFSKSTLAELYDPLAMPPELLKAHAELDKAVDRCYRNQPFINDRQRVEFLFALYEKYTAPLASRPAIRRSRARPTHRRSMR